MCKIKENEIRFVIMMDSFTRLKTRYMFSRGKRRTEALDDNTPLRNYLQIEVRVFTFSDVYR